MQQPISEIFPAHAISEIDRARAREYALLAALQSSQHPGLPGSLFPKTSGSDAYRASHFGVLFHDLLRAALEYFCS